MASHLHFCGNNLLVAVCLAHHSYTLWPWPWLYFKDMAVSGCWNWSFEPQDSFVSGPVQTLNDCESHEWLSDPWMIVSHMDHFMPLFASASCCFFLFFFFLLLLTFSFAVYIASVCCDQVSLVSGVEVSVYLWSGIKTILTVKVAEWEESRCKLW